MPITPTPTIYTCPACGWSKTVTPRGDMLMPGEFFATCPRCGHAPLENRPALGVFIRQALGNLTQKIKSTLH